MMRRLPTTDVVPPTIYKSLPVNLRKALLLTNKYPEQISYTRSNAYRQISLLKGVLHNTRDSDTVTSEATRKAADIKLKEFQLFCDGLDIMDCFYSSKK